MRILGIDPGTKRIGYGLIQGVRQPKLLTYGVIEVKSIDEAAALLELSDKFSALLQELKPELAGVERVYFSKNQKTAIPVSQARGVIMVALLGRGVRVREWRPVEVKQAITNYGFADKKAVAKMVARILGVESFTGYDDATDALAIAIATAFRETGIPG